MTPPVRAHIDKKTKISPNQENAWLNSLIASKATATAKIQQKQNQTVHIMNMRKQVTSENNTFLHDDGLSLSDFRSTGDKAFGIITPSDHNTSPLLNGTFEQLLQ